MARSIFYSWQSDSPPKANRFFIQDCLIQVLKKLNRDDDMDEAVRLDHDTAGIPGTPDIANTIFTKIKEAEVFVADLTLSSESESGKKSPNPNVLIEIGYAFSAIGDARVVTAMNTAYGEPKHLPFDLAHKRWPVQYALSEVGSGDCEERVTQKRNLTDSLYTAIHLILEASAPSAATLQHLAGAPSLQYIQERISLSDPQEGWEIVSSSTSSIAINKHDVNLHLMVSHMDDGIQCSDFTEEWANRHPDPHATGYWCDIRYGVTRVFRTILVSVDGGRAMLPVPRQAGIDGKRSEVLPFDYRIAQIFDSLGTLDQYMRRSGLSVAFGPNIQV